MITDFDNVYDGVKEASLSLYILAGFQAPGSPRYRQFSKPRGFDLKQFEVPNGVFMVNVPCQNAKIKGELLYPQTFF